MFGIYISFHTIQLYMIFRLKIETPSHDHISVYENITPKLWTNPTP